MSAGEPCLARGLPLCFFSFFTFWVTSWKSAREAATSPPLCFTTGFPGSPQGSLPQDLFNSSNAVHRSGDIQPSNILVHPGKSVAKDFRSEVAELWRELACNTRDKPRQSALRVRGLPCESSRLR